MIVAVVNTKGGVGKTVSCVHLGAALAAAGHATLLVDVDLQHGLTNYFHIEPGGPTTADVLLSRATLAEATQQVRERLFLVPADGSMDQAEVELTAAPAGEVRLRRAFQSDAARGASKFAFTFIDCPSGWGTVTRNAVLASDALLVPINSEPPAFTNAIDTIALARDLVGFYSQRVGLLGVLLTRFRATTSAHTVESRALAEWGVAVFATRIRQAERVNVASITRETLAEMSPAAAGGVGVDYAELACEVIERARAKKGTKGGKQHGQKARA